MNSFNNVFGIEGRLPSSRHPRGLASPEYMATVTFITAALRTEAVTQIDIRNLNRLAWHVEQQLPGSLTYHNKRVQLMRILGQNMVGDQDSRQRIEEIEEKADAELDAFTKQIEGKEVSAVQNGELDIPLDGVFDASLLNAKQFELLWSARFKRYGLEVEPDLLYFT